MPAEPVDLSRRRCVHIVGIGGAGMSGLARVLVGWGHAVSGSDATPSSTLDDLAAVGISTAVGHDANNVVDADLVTASPAVPADNPELAAARARGIEVASRAAMLAGVASQRRTVAVAGTHGKTTTSSMLAVVLSAAGLAPSWLVGAAIRGLGDNGASGSGDTLVLEADESYGSFESLTPSVVALTSVEDDHLDYYGTRARLHEAFSSLLARATTTLVYNDDPIARTLGAPLRSRTVGTTSTDDYVVGSIVVDRERSRFGLRHAGDVIEIEIKAPGRHNVADAALAAATALELGVDATTVREGLAAFEGASRRYEPRGVVRGATVVDDYGHLPGEVAAAIRTARDGGWRRIVAVFQPHRFTRTAALSAQFADAFGGVDVLVVTDVYSAGEPPIPGVSGELVAAAVRSSSHAPDVHYVPDRSALAAEVAALLEHGDLLLTLGAGDVTDLADELAALRP
jgi:UDP-N-acetylmuramate--alanine ligase